MRYCNLDTLVITQRQRTTGWTQLSLATGGERWNWLLNYGRQGSDDAVSVGAQIRY